MSLELKQPYYNSFIYKNCLFICRDCLAGAIEHCDAPQVTCPYKDDNYSCDMTLLDREIKAVMIYLLFLRIIKDVLLIYLLFL